MTKLLVSVRDVNEARIALEAGVDLIDLKEPSRGALGAVDFETAREVVALRDSEPRFASTPLSIALGELADHFPTDEAPADHDEVRLAQARMIPDGIRFAKVGLAGCSSRVHWRAQLRVFARHVVKSRAFVAVVYADAEAVDAPKLHDVLEIADGLQARALLVDTAVKDGRTVFDHWSTEQMTAFVRRHKVLTVVGGGLTVNTIPLAAAYYPNYIAVRGAACAANRESRIDASRIKAVREAIPKHVVRT